MKSLSFLANVCFLHDRSRLISIGSDDRTIIQWKFLSESDSIALIETRRKSVAGVGAQPGEAADTSTGELMDELTEDVQALQAGQHAVSYLDSDSEGSDSDLSGAEIDSDIEKERQISYERTLYREDYKVKAKFVERRIISFLVEI